MREKKFSFTGRAILAVVLALLIADGVMGLILHRQNRLTMKSMIDARILDIANTAADMLDGDALERLTAADADTPEYRAAYDALKVFQDNIALEYIYAINDNGDGTFSFSVDPSDDPGEFGSPVVATAALRKAATGVPAVDAKPYTDAWGSFYSAYSPVFNSRGAVAAIVGVDFSADWYDSQISNNTFTILVLSTFSVILGAGIAFLVTSRFRQRFTALSSELSDLAQDMEELTQELVRGAPERLGTAPAEPAQTEPKKGPDGDDEIAALGEEIRSMQQDLRGYIAYARAQVYVDALTGVGSKTAYLEMLQASQKHFDDGTAAFTVTIFDLNDLKGVNDNLGHEVGDIVIQDAARAISAAFGPDHLYRIGGDEFIAVRAHAGELELAKWTAALEHELAAANETTPDLPLSISWGSAVYDPAVDADYRAVFKRADDAMYEMKNAYYRRRGGRGGTVFPQKLG